MSDINIGAISASVNLDLSSLKQGVTEAIGSFNKIDQSIRVSCGAITQNVKVMAAAVKSDIEKLADAQRRAMQGFQTLSNAALSAGGGIAKAFEAAVKTAIDFESAFAGVRKVVEGSPEQLNQIQKALENLSARVPLKFEDLAGIAENAGQLGVERENIVGFTEVVAKLAATTNLTADSAATSLARISSIMKIPQADFERLGSTLVDIGKKGASTEKDIVGLAVRLAPAARQVGLPAQELLALSAAMSDVGIRAQAGGTAMSRFFAQIATAVHSGNSDLRAFSNIAGVTSEQFKRAWSADKGRAIDLIVHGLGTLKANGTNLFAVLDTLGIKSSQSRQTILALAGAGNALTKQLDAAQNAWTANTALTQTYGERAKTTAAQVQAFQNDVRLLGKEVGETLLPALRPVVQHLKDLVDWFRNLSPEIRGTYVNIGLWAGGLSLGIGLIGRFVAGLQSIITAYKGITVWAGLARTAQATGGVSAAVGRGTIGAGVGAGATAGGFGLLGVGAAALGWLGLDAADASNKASEAQLSSNELPNLTAFTEKIRRLKEQLKADPNNAGLKKQIDDTFASARRLLPGAATGGTNPAIEAQKKADAMLKQMGIDSTAPHFNPADFKKEKKGRGGSDKEDMGDIIAAHITSATKTSAFKASCAFFVSEVLKQSGAGIRGSNSVKDLWGQLIAAGAETVSGNLERGDILKFHGKNFGTSKDAEGKGNHTGIYLGNGQFVDSHDYNTRRPVRNLSDYLKANPDADVSALRLGNQDDRASALVDRRQDALDKQREAAEATQRAYDTLFEASHTQAEVAIRDAARERDAQIAAGADRLVAYRAYAATVQQIETELTQKILQLQNERALNQQQSAEKLAKQYEDAGRAAAEIANELDQQQLEKAMADAAAEYEWREQKFREAERDKEEAFRRDVERNQEQLEMDTRLLEVRQQDNSPENFHYDPGAKSREMVERFRENIQNMAQDVRSVLGGAFEAVFDGKDFFKSLLQGFTQMLKQMVAQALAAGIVKLIFGASTGGGGFLGGLFGFDDAINDSKAARWGFDFAHHAFQNGISRELNTQKPFTGVQQGRNAGRGDTHINIHVPQIIVREQADIGRVADALAWRMQSELRGAYVGG